MIINLTQHAATSEQLAAGVTDLAEEHRATLVRLLTFEALPGLSEIEARASDIAEMAALLASDAATDALSDDEANAAGDPVDVAAMIGGAPFLMPALELALRARGIAPLYARSRSRPRRTGR